MVFCLQDQFDFSPKTELTTTFYNGLVENVYYNSTEFIFNPVDSVYRYEIPSSETTKIPYV